MYHTHNLIERCVKVRILSGFTCTATIFSFPDSHARFIITECLPSSAGGDLTPHLRKSAWREGRTNETRVTAFAFTRRQPSSSATGPLSSHPLSQRHQTLRTDGTAECGRGCGVSQAVPALGTHRRPPWGPKGSSGVTQEQRGTSPGPWVMKRDVIPCKKMERKSTSKPKNRLVFSSAAAEESILRSKFRTKKPLA